MYPRTPNIPVTDPDLAAYDPQRLAIDQLSPAHQAELARLGFAADGRSLSSETLDIVGADALQALQLARVLARTEIPLSQDWCADEPGGCNGNLGLYRNEMPQIADKTAAKLAASSKAAERDAAHAILLTGGPRDKTVLDAFLDHLRKMGVSIAPAKVAVGGLRATQREIQTKKAFEMADAHLRGAFPSLSADTVVVSSDWHLLDGHHRWAALMTIDPARLMQVIQIDLPIRDILRLAAAFPGVYAADLEGRVQPDPFQLEYKRKAKAELAAHKRTRSPNPPLPKPLREQLAEGLSLNPSTEPVDTSIILTGDDLGALHGKEWLTLHYGRHAPRDFMLQDIVRRFVDRVEDGEDGNGHLLKDGKRTGVSVLASVLPNTYPPAAGVTFTVGPRAGITVAHAERFLKAALRAALAEKLEDAERSFGERFESDPRERVRNPVESVHRSIPMTRRSNPSESVRIMRSANPAKIAKTSSDYRAADAEVARLADAYLELRMTQGSDAADVVAARRRYAEAVAKRDALGLVDLAASALTLNPHAGSARTGNPARPLTKAQDAAFQEAMSDVDQESWHTPLQRQVGREAARRAARKYRSNSDAYHAAVRAYWKAAEEEGNRSGRKDDDRTGNPPALIWEFDGEPTSPKELLADNPDNGDVAAAVAYLKAEGAKFAMGRNSTKSGRSWAAVSFGGGAADEQVLTVRAAWTEGPVFKAVLDASAIPYAGDLPDAD